MTAFCALVDWGTTSFRIWIVDGKGQVLGHRRSDEGMATRKPGDDGFGPVLEEHLRELEAPANLPVLICGMAGAREGWKEAPYMNLPARIADIASGAVRLEGQDRDIRIIPGLAQMPPSAPDVMRGEETQLLGMIADADDRQLVCMPGTHCKWVEIAEGAVVGFRTFLTGDLYNAISTATILAKSVPDDEPAFDEAAFRDAVSRVAAGSDGLSAELFSIRAGQLVGGVPAATAPSILSGLLIGSEITASRNVLAAYGRHVTLIGSGVLAERYAMAFDVSDVKVRLHPAEALTQNGLFAIASHLYAGSVSEDLS